MLNKVILMGRITKELELKRTQSDISVCSFTIAIDRKFVKQGEERKADFINCVAWRQQADFLSKYFHKGSMVNVIGSLQTRTWDDNNNVRHYVTEVVVEEVNFTGEKAANSGQGQAYSAPPQSYGQPPQQPSHGGMYEQNDGFAPIETTDDLPF